MQTAQKGGAPVENRGAFRGLILIQLLAFGSFASMNYYSVFLRGIGFSGEQLGLWGSVVSLIGMVTLPVWGLMADKMGSSKRLYLVAMVAFGCVYCLLPFLGGLYPAAPLPLYATLLLYAAIVQPTHSLQDAWLIPASASSGVPYAKVRAFGSLGFGLLSILYGFITKWGGTAVALYMAPLLVLPLVLFCLRFKADGAQSPRISRQSPAVLLQNRRLLCAFLMTIVLGCYGAFITPFYPFILEHAGVAADRFGWVSGYGALIQVGVLYAFNRWFKNAPLPLVLVTAGLFGVAENALYALASNLPMMFAAATLWGVAMALNVSALPLYVYSLVPGEHVSTAISLNASVVMLFSIIGNFSGGLLLTALGIERYLFCVAGFRLAVTLLFLLSALPLRPAKEPRAG
ncbi:MAG: MFS transporter [Christensenellaceae bacterium]|nr:MFS transporter [Christensenellaceae bacterium]